MDINNLLKNYTIKILSLAMSGLFFFNSSVYGIDISGKTCLRINLTSNTSKGIERLKEFYEQYGDSFVSKIRNESAGVEQILEWYEKAREYYTIYSEGYPDSNVRIIGKLHELAGLVIESLAKTADSEAAIRNVKALEMPAREAKEDKLLLINRMWESNGKIYKIIKEAENAETARKKLISYLNEKRDTLFSGEKNGPYSDLADNEKLIIYGIINSFQSMLQPYFIDLVNKALKREHNNAPEYSIIEYLWQLAHSGQGKTGDLLEKTDISFFYEFIHMFRRLDGDMQDRFAKNADLGIVMDMANKMQGAAAARIREPILDFLSFSADTAFLGIDSGLSPELVREYEKNKKYILKVFNGTEADWNNWKWQARHIVRNRADMEKMGVKLTPGEGNAIDALNQNKRIFSITPHHIALMSQNPSLRDLAIRRQVMPEEEHLVWELIASSDVMRENDTSPADRVVRRYAKICVLNVVDSCFQDCRYCQRAQLQKLGDATTVSSNDIKAGIEYIRGNKAITQVLVTGGDPLKMSTGKIDWILGELCSIKHVDGIRIGTRAFAVLPQRFDDELLKVLEKYHKRKPITLVTHFEHPREVTPYTREAVQKVKKLGIEILNQQVFTRYVSSRHIASALNMSLVDIGIRPYYIFFPKPKKEQRAYFVPIARILQMWREEMRLLPGIGRTGQIVFNVPGKGKMQLIDGTGYRLIGILPDGQRAYLFSSWYYGLLKDPAPYVHFDIPILEYLTTMRSEMGESPEDYASIWDYGYGGSVLGFMHTIARLRYEDKIENTITIAEINKFRIKDKSGAKFSYSTVWREFYDAEKLGLIRKLKKADGAVVRRKGSIVYEIIAELTKGQLRDLAEDEAIIEALKRGRIREEEAQKIINKITSVITSSL
jgi:lysine 2,3-aminomutase